MMAQPPYRSPPSTGNRFVSAIVIAAALAGTSATAQIAVSANDGKQLRGSQTTANLRPDEIVSLDLGQSPARVLGRLVVDTSMIGPPSSVAVSKDGKRALVTASLALAQKEGQPLEAGTTLSLIDLSTPRSPTLLQSLSVGPNLSGVSFSDDGRFAVAVSAGDAAVHLFSVAAGYLTQTGVYRFGKDDRAIDADIGPDNRTVLAPLQNRGLLARLRLQDGRLTSAGSALEVGQQPYGVLIDRQGRYAYISLLGGRKREEGEGLRTPGPRMGAVAVVDIQAWRLVNVVDVGVTPEYVTLSPDGRRLLVVLINGSNANPSSADYRSGGIVKIFTVDGPTLTIAAEAVTSGWCQGATWAADGRRVFVQCTTDKVLEVFAFDGSALTPLPQEKLAFDTRPGAIATAQTR